MFESESKSGLINKQLITAVNVLQTALIII